MLQASIEPAFHSSLPSRIDETLDILELLTIAEGYGIAEARAHECFSALEGAPPHRTGFMCLGLQAHGETMLPRLCSHTERFEDLRQKLHNHIFLPPRDPTYVALVSSATIGLPKLDMCTSFGCSSTAARVEMVS